MDLEHVIDEEIDDRERIVNNLRNVFHEADEMRTGKISWEMLKAHLDDSTVHAYFKTLNIEIWDLRTFFELSEGGVDEAVVNIDEFVRACLRLKGPAKNADVVVLRHQLEMLSK